MKKKAYMNPTMRVVVLKQGRMLCSSGGRSVKNLGSSPFSWDEDGLEDGELDM